MARQRRGKGRPPELKGTLGTLINTAIAQAGVVRDAARSALERGARETRSRLDNARSSRRRDELLADLGDIVLDLIRQGEIDLAELPEAKPIVAELDELDAVEEEPEDVVRSATRSRFDDRPPTRDRDDDGTVSSKTRSWSKPTTPATPRVWRPNVDAAPEPPAPSSREKPRLPNNPARKGGIAFDDEDLAEYMHPDDVPPKDGDS